MKLTVFNLDGTKSYALSFHSKEHGLWLTNELGEGMTIQPEKLFDLIDEYFQKNF